MADATATASRYEISVEDAGPARKRLSITVPADVVDEKVADSFGALGANAQIPGFRKGKAPRALIEKRFGASVREETRNQVVAEAYSAALEEHELKPVSEPEPVTEIETLEIAEGQPLSFVVEVEVVPDMTLPELDGIDVKKPLLPVDDELIAQEIEAQAMRHGDVRAIDGDFQPGDKVVGPGWAKKDGDDEPFFTHDEIDVIVPEAEDGGRGAVLGLPVDGLHDLLVGKKVGDVLELTVTGPESHELEDIRGKELTIHVEISKGLRVDPVETEKLVELLGVGTEDNLKEQIKLALENRAETEQQALMREQVYRYLGESAEFELPSKMTENQTARLLERQRLEMLYRGGMTPEAVEQRIAEMRTDAADETRRRLKLQFLLHKLADDLGVTVTEQEVNGRIAMLAMQRNMRPDKLKQNLVENGMIGQVGTQIRDHKAVDRVLEKANVTEMSREDFIAWRDETEKAAAS